MLHQLPQPPEPRHTHRGAAFKTVGLGERRHPFGVAASRCQASINQKAVAVLHQAMADEAELGLLARSLAIEPCIGIRSRRPGGHPDQ